MRCQDGGNGLFGFGGTGVQDCDQPLAGMLQIQMCSGRPGAGD